MKRFKAYEQNLTFPVKAFVFPQLPTSTKLFWEARKIRMKKKYNANYFDNLLQGKKYNIFEFSKSESLKNVRLIQQKN